MNKRINTSLVIRLLLSAIVVAGLSSANTVAHALPVNVQPYLLHLAQSAPNDSVQIIVQLSTSPELLTEEINTLGGTITANLSIINAVAVEMRAEAVLQLATNKSVRWISYDAPALSAGGPDGSVSTSNLKNVYNRAVNLPNVWSQGYQGSTIGVAVVDSGITSNMDLLNNAMYRVVANVAFIDGYQYNGVNQLTVDGYGHGTHVAGIIGGNGINSYGNYIGVAPKVKLINVKVSNDKGIGNITNVVNGLQWILKNKSTYNIRVVNISLNSTIQESYNTSPLDAAVEILWFNGIVVVVSAGNNGTASLYPPANDPFAITVGATDDKGTTSLSDDVVTGFSAYGTTLDGVAKPDLVAPGRNIISVAADSYSQMYMQHPTNVVSDFYFKMSGTSMSAPIVSGAIALLLQDEPNLTPDQVKYRLKATANKSWNGYSSTKAGAGYLDVYAALSNTSTASANTNQPASRLLWTGSQPVTWSSINWNSVNWNSVNWNSVNWNSVNWNSVNWNSDYWESGVTAAEADLIANEDEEASSENATPIDESAQSVHVFLPFVTR